ncbi:hypothetical protein NDA18_001586 [Ustilago nuda]|nr:hypothetical protein NDA18_001586 [Ustilago nuda]
MIANLPPTEKQALFGLLDEYFASRPHRLPAAGTSTQTPAARGSLTDRATNSVGNAAGAAAGVAVTNALRDQLTRSGLSSKGPPPPAPSSSSKPGFGGPAGLVSGKTRQTFGGLHIGPKTQPTTQVPPTTTTAPQASASRTLPPPTRTGASVPTSTGTAAAVPVVAAVPPGVTGTAQVLYDYGDASDPDDLEAVEGEQIYLTEKISDDWWRGMSTDQSRHGIIPTAYVRPL